MKKKLISPLINLKKLNIRLLETSEDIDDANTFIARQHNLGEKKPIGYRMYYAVEYMHKGSIVWVAVLLFDKAIDRVAVRDSEIGWDPAVREQNIKHIANNSRFAIHESARTIPNMASYVLSAIINKLGG